jgi:hypothetical protein
MKACGEAVAMLQEHRWVPTLLSDRRVNVGTLPAAPDPNGLMRPVGKARRQLMPPEGGGGPVVVRSRENRLHAPLPGAGEGVQHINEVISTLMPLVAVIGFVSLLVAVLSTVGVFLRLRTASLSEIQLRLAALEGMLLKRSAPEDGDE